MRMPRFRFTVRGMMVAVAVVAVPLASMAVIERRRAAFERAASYHDGQIIGKILPNHPPPSYRFSTVRFDTLQPLSDREIRRNHWHGDLYIKYVLAARRPWLPVAPDPPEPN